MAQTLAWTWVPDHGFEFDVGLGLATAWYGAGTSTERGTELTNLAVALHLPWLRARRLSYRFGLEVATGLLGSPAPGEKRILRGALTYGLAMAGGWRAWRWAPDRTSFALPALLLWPHDLGSDRQAELTVEAAVARVMAVNDFGAEPAADFAELSMDYRVRAIGLVWLTLRGQLVWMPDAPFEVLQTAVAPGLEARWGRWRAGASYLLNLDAPFGFGARGLRIWAANLHLGVWR